jgi:dihydrofolate reductase
MRQVALQMGMSLDGYVASDREHPGVAVPEDAELISWKLDRVAKAGAHLMGRATYQEMAAYWPRSTHPYAAPMNDIPKVVFSKTLDLSQASWPTTRIARGDLAEEIAALKQEPGPDVIAHGGASFAAALAAQGLIDEYCLVIQPVAVHIYRPRSR